MGERNNYFCIGQLQGKRLQENCTVLSYNVNITTFMNGQRVYSFDGPNRDAFQNTLIVELLSQSADSSGIQPALANSLLDRFFQRRFWQRIPKKAIVEHQPFTMTLERRLLLIVYR
ncbi:hypothetical protein Y032_0010g867 [Ancylostoma ceylanicum]|uniref:Uncharacterized protein n=1 Tax=Ancylostoma ceylanicum TaxID=53326 RepID=A0A016VIP5_9BILA|nr:hypothetical protein Y032_0010g867 [Ancylostoma ceylanicum]